MLASPANQLTAAGNSVRTANLLTLEFSGTQHAPVLLSPGKWNVGSAAANQIELNVEGVATRQFLIVVTEHRSIIKDWSNKALLNGKLFDSEVLGDGDLVEIADVRLSFRLAESLDLIAQLPYVAEPDSPGDKASNAAAESSFVEGADRLDELIASIEMSLSAEGNSAAKNTDADQKAVTDAEVTGPALIPEVDSTPSDSPMLDVLNATELDETETASFDNSSLEQQAPLIDDELQQLEQLRAAVRREREQLLAKRELLAQERRLVELHLNALNQEPELFLSAVADADGVDDAKGSEGTSIEHADCFIAKAESYAEGEQVLDVSCSNPDGNGEDEALAAEREKLRHYLEEFDSADDAACDQAVEIEVAIGAAQGTTDYNVMNALRSREAAVKQLDELVLAATRGQDLSSFAKTNTRSDGAIDRQSFEKFESSNSSCREIGTSSFGHELNEPEAVEENADERAEIESSVDDLGALINSVEVAEAPNEEETETWASRETMQSDTWSEAQDTVVIDDRPAAEFQEADLRCDDSSSYDSDFSVSGLESESITDFDESEPTVDHEVLISSVFDDDDASLTLGKDIANQCQLIDDLCELELADKANDENVFDFPDRDVYAIGNQPSVDVSEEADGDQSNVESDAATTNVDLVNSETDSNSEIGELEAETVEAGFPSWFDSKFMVESDSVVDEESDAELQNRSSSDADVVPEGVEKVGSFADRSTVDLRQKLAEMFDLPSLSTNNDSVNSEVEDNSLDVRLRPFHSEDRSHQAAEFDERKQHSAWPEPFDHDVDDNSSSELNDDLTQASDLAADVEFASETLDEFPETTSDDAIAVEGQSAQNQPSFAPEQEDEEEDSVSAYMERLLARNRQVTGRSAAPVEPRPSEPVVTEPTVASSESASQPGGIVAATAQSQMWLEATPRHRQNRDQVRAEVQAFRQIANQSARSAVATASRRDVRKQVIVKTTASLLALGFGATALLLDISMVFGLVVLCIGMLFAGDLTLTIFRNWNQLRKLRRAAAAIERNAVATKSGSPVGE
ncbi:MAG: hypothetical protein HQ518_03370 [Rhodopirellula sp.]|nr:hypothetical protein [Rhodopirellula sp.]